MALIPLPLAKPLAGLPGQWQNMEECNSFTAFAEAAIAFGQAVMQGATTTPDSVGVLPLTTGNKFIGFALENIYSSGAPVNGDPRYGVGDTLGVADMGVVFVKTGGAVVKGNAVWYLPSTGLYYAATGAGRMLLPGCEYDQTGASGDNVPVRIRIRPGEAAITAA